MDLNKISQIEFSKRDNKRNIRLPSSLNEDLSELTGILIGDGHLSCPCKKRAIKRTPYQVIVSGSLSEDWDYFHTVTNKIFLKNFNVKLRVVKHKNSNCFGAVVDSKAIFCYFTRI